MKMDVGQNVEWLDESVTSYPYKNSLLGEVISVDDENVQLCVLMHPDENKEGEIRKVKLSDVFSLTNKVWTVYEDHQIWRKLGRAAYEYHVGDVIKSVIGLELYYVTAIEEDMVEYTYYEDGAWLKDFFECSNASYCLVVPAEKRVDALFGECVF